jgi:hypothetical protein
MKKIVAACIDRILEFDTQAEAVKYLGGLREKETDFRILNREEINGKYRIRVKEQYNKNPMIED